MGLFDRFFSGNPSGPPAHAPSPDQDRDLVLYKFDSCPYCRRVMRVAKDLKLDVPMRDTRRDSDALDTLFETTGRTQVPCLFIDGEPLFESADIDQWLRAYAARQPAS